MPGVVVVTYRASCIPLLLSQDQQGHRRTLYVHGSVVFESVLDILNYTRMLCDNFVDSEH